MSKDFKRYVENINKSCEKYLDYIEKMGNECAYTDRIIEDIMTNNSLLRLAYNKKFNEEENINGKVIEIEDTNGNTILGFEVDMNGNIIKYKNCDIADIDSDYIFDTDKDLIRVQENEEELC